MQSSLMGRVRDAVAALLVAVLRDLSVHDGNPKIGANPDLRGWWRYGQESFVALRPDSWHMPQRVTAVGWLDTFDEMAAVREAIDADRGLGWRLDTMVGTGFSLHQRSLDWVLVQHLLDPMVVTSRDYAFNEVVFDELFSQLNAGLRADSIRLVELIPLNGFESAMCGITLPDGIVLRPMTDQQISNAIQFLAVPAEFSGGPNSVQVSRFHQWAVTRVQGYPVRSYKQGMPERPEGPDFPSVEEPAHRLVTALRVVCGGSVVATRPILVQHEDDFPPTLQASAVRSAVITADIDRPTRMLTDEHVEAVRDVYEMLATTAVRADRSLQVALRRLLVAGSKTQPEDRLIDLVICCEALFLKRHGIGGRQKGGPASANAGRLLADDLVLGFGRSEVELFVAAAYRLRNAEVHGDPPVQRSMTLLDGAQTSDIAHFVDDLQLLVGRAIHLVLSQVVRTDSPAEVAP